jgi:hypothetical protein
MNRLIGASREQSKQQSTHNTIWHHHKLNHKKQSSVGSLRFNDSESCGNPSDFAESRHDLEHEVADLCRAVADVDPL